MVESIEVGRQTELSNGTRVLVEELNPVEKNPNQGRVPLAEAAHVVIDPDNVIYVDGNMTRIKQKNPVQAAAHHGDGDGHDRAITEADGHNFDLVGVAADAILSTRWDQVIAVAGELNKRGGRISGTDAKEVIERVKSGPDLRITAVTPEGKRHTFVEKEVKKKEVIIVNFMDEDSENEKQDNSTRRSNIVEFPLTRTLEKAA
jgi:hypothetical protein